MPKTFFITTAIDYTNSAPHIGHAYEKVLADVIARYHRLKGEEVFFLTGVDEHGQKVQQSAAKEGVAPAEFVKGITQKFVNLWKKLDVKYDEWAETTDERHKKVVRGILQRLFDEGQIYKDKQAGYYSVRQEQFITDKERGPDGQFGADWGEVEFREEENYYFRLEQHKQWLLSYIDNRKDAVIPDFRQTELRNAVEKLSGDLCISRPKSRLDWGIELPFDKDFVTYVWFDALTNYISFADYDPALSTFDSQPSTFRDRWPALQIIGKDILIPAHGIYWLIMLHALGFSNEAMPQLLVHGWWNLGGAKMSKTAGNVVDPFALTKKYGAEALRYYLMSDIITGQDANFDDQRLSQERYNNDLANKHGNLVNRLLSMANQYVAGLLHKDSFFDDPHVALFLSTSDPSINCPEKLAGPNAGLWARIARLQSLGRLTKEKSQKWFDNYQISAAIEHIGFLSRESNEFIEATAPWKLAKEKSLIVELHAVLYVLAETIRLIAILISPVLPKAVLQIFDQLDPEKKLNRDFRLEDAKWGGLLDGHVVGKPVPLFPRIEG